MPYGGGGSNPGPPPLQLALVSLRPALPPIPRGAPPQALFVQGPATSCRNLAEQQTLRDGRGGSLPQAFPSASVLDKEGSRPLPLARTPDLGPAAGPLPEQLCAPQTSLFLNYLIAREGGLCFGNYSHRHAESRESSPGWLRVPGHASGCSRQGPWSLSWGLPTQCLGGQHLAARPHPDSPSH